MRGLNLLQKGKLHMIRPEDPETVALYGFIVRAAHSASVSVTKIRNARHNTGLRPEMALAVELRKVIIAADEANVALDRDGKPLPTKLDGTQCTQAEADEAHRAYHYDADGDSSND